MADETASHSTDSGNFAMIKTRLELARAMDKSPNAPERDHGDMSIAMELLGTFVCHTTISRMVLQRKLSLEAGAYLNGVISLHAFCPTHAATHEGISQHNENLKAFENSIFRLGNLLAGFTDEWKRDHHVHHAKTNTDEDPDAWAAKSPLPELGKVVGLLVNNPYIFLERQDIFPNIHASWNNWIGRIARKEVVKYMFQHHPDSAHCLQATWDTATDMAQFILILFFGRYPHRNGISMESANEIGNFYDTTYRGQGEVDLWMMGEGWHHGHHAKTDVPYNVLPKVGMDVEGTYPDLKRNFRTTMDIGRLEGSQGLPPRLQDDTSGPDPQFWQRTCAVRAAVSSMFREGGSSKSVEKALTEVSDICLSTAFHVATSVDLALLRDLFHKMDLTNNEAVKESLDFNEWPRTIFADETQQEVREKVGLIRTQLAQQTAKLAEHLQLPKNIATGSDIKDCFLPLLESVIKAAIHPTKLDDFFHGFCRFLKQDCDEITGTPLGEACSQSLMERLREHLEAPLPSFDVKKEFGSLQQVKCLLSKLLQPVPRAKL